MASLKASSAWLHWGRDTHAVPQGGGCAAMGPKDESGAGKEAGDWRKPEGWNRGLTLKPGLGTSHTETVPC